MNEPAIKVVPLNELRELIGKELFTSPWIEMSQERVTAFADCTGDNQWIHVDPQRAASGPFGGTIAHGFLSMSLLTYFSSFTNVVPQGTVMALNYGFDSVRFLNPVKVGRKIRDRAELTAVDEKGNGRVLLNTKHTVEIEGEDKPALVAQWLFMYFTA